MVGKKVKINKNIGTIVKEDDVYCLIKFSFGQFVFNKLMLGNKIIDDDKALTE